jgi:hypothetical protein
MLRLIYPRPPQRSQPRIARRTQIVRPLPQKYTLQNNRTLWSAVKKIWELTEDYYIAMAHGHKMPHGVTVKEDHGDATKPDAHGHGHGAKAVDHAHKADHKAPSKEKEAGHGHKHEEHADHGYGHGHGHGHAAVPLHEALLGWQKGEESWKNEEGGFSSPLRFTETDLRRHHDVAKEVGIDVRFLNDPTLHLQFMKIGQLFNKLGIQDDAKRQEDLINTALISPGFSTLDWMFPYPPPEHTFTELPIVKMHEGQVAELEEAV